MNSTQSKGVWTSNEEDLYFKFIIPKSESICSGYSSAFPGHRWMLFWDSWLDLELACQGEANLVSLGPIFNPSEKNDMDNHEFKSCPLTHLLEWLTLKKKTPQKISASEDV